MSENAWHKGKWVAHFLLFIERTYVGRASWKELGTTHKLTTKHKMPQYDGLSRNMVWCYLQTVDPGCIMLHHTLEPSFVTYLLLVVVEWDHCVAVKGAVHLRAVCHGMGWDKAPVQHKQDSPASCSWNEIQHLNSIEMNNPTHILCFVQQDKACRNKYSNTYILSNNGWAMKCDKIMSQKFDWLAVDHLVDCLDMK